MPAPIPAVSPGEGVSEAVSTGPRDCRHCGVWTCSACGWKRHNAALAHPELQDCARCSGTDGTLRPTRHSARRWGLCNDDQDWII